MAISEPRRSIAPAERSRSARAPRDIDQRNPPGRLAAAKRSRSRHARLVSRVRDLQNAHARTPHDSTTDSLSRPLLTAAIRLGTCSSSRTPTCAESDLPRVSLILISEPRRSVAGPAERPAQQNGLALSTAADRGHKTCSSSRTPTWAESDLPRVSLILISEPRRSVAPAERLRCARARTRHRSTNSGGELRIHSSATA